MSAGFGFSIGDLVLGLKLIKQSIEALEDTKGSSANYQALHHEIHSLQDGLEAVQELRLEKRLGPKSKSGIAIQDAVVRCQRCINVFLSTISKYQPWLKTNNASISAWKANLRKIQWALCKKEDVIRFRAQLERHSSSISMLLVTLQVSQSFEQSTRFEIQNSITVDCHQKTIDSQKNLEVTSVALLGLSLEQRQLFQSLIESNRQLVQANERMADEIQQMRRAVQLQVELPPQVPLQKPITLLDACGKVSAFHLDFISCSEAFLAVLKIRFQQYGVEDRGIQMLDDSQFVLEDHKGKLDLSRPWSKVLKPSQKVHMSMVFRDNISSSTCPACQMVNGNNLESRIECSRCGLFYHRVEEETTDLDLIAKAERGTNMDETNHKEDPDDQQRNDLFDQFRRVQLVCPRPRPRLSFRSKDEWKRHVNSLFLHRRGLRNPSWDRAKSSLQNLHDANGTLAGLRAEGSKANLRPNPAREASEVEVSRRSSMVDSSTTTLLLERLDERASQMSAHLSENSKPSGYQVPDDIGRSKSGLEMEQSLRVTEVGPHSHPDDFEDLDDVLGAVTHGAVLSRSMTSFSRSVAQEDQGEGMDKSQPPKDSPISKPKRSKRSRQAPPNSPFHLFDMAAALLNNVEENLNK